MRRSQRAAVGTGDGRLGGLELRVQWVLELGDTVGAGASGDGGCWSWDAEVGAGAGGCCGCWRQGWAMMKPGATERWRVHEPEPTAMVGAPAGGAAVGAGDWVVGSGGCCGGCPHSGAKPGVRPQRCAAGS